MSTLAVVLIAERSLACKYSIDISSPLHKETNYVPFLCDGHRLQSCPTICNTMLASAWLMGKTSIHAPMNTVLAFAPNLSNALAPSQSEVHIATSSAVWPSTFTGTQLA